jgi:hypothetical protein
MTDLCDGVGESPHSHPGAAKVKARGGNGVSLSVQQDNVVRGGAGRPGRARPGEHLVTPAPPARRLSRGRGASLTSHTTEIRLQSGVAVARGGVAVARWALACAVCCENL